MKTKTKALVYLGFSLSSFAVGAFGGLSHSFTLLAVAYLMASVGVSVNFVFLWGTQ